MSDAKKEFWMDQTGTLDNGKCITFEAHTIKPKDWDSDKAATDVHVVSAHWRDQCLKLEAALEEVNKSWFDGFDPKNNSTVCPACMFCDMGDSGEKRNRDGHDVRCHVSQAREALEAFREWKGEE